MSQPGVEISVVVPAYNEADNIGPFVDATRHVLEPLASSFEIIFVDDGSRDGTWDQVIEMHKVDARVRGIALSRNFGKEAALAAGLDAARGQAVIVMDSDLQHPPALIPHMVQAWREGSAVIVEGIKRRRRGEPYLRRMLSSTFGLAARLLTGVDFTNASDFKLLDRRVLNALGTMREKRRFFRGMSNWVGFPRQQLEFDVEARSGGRSKWTSGQLVWLAWQGIASYSSAPLRITHFVSAVFMALAVILSVQTLHLKWAGLAVSGFTTVIILQLIIGGLLLFCLAIVTEYIIAIYDEVKGRPSYLLRDTLG